MHLPRRKTVIWRGRGRGWGGIDGIAPDFLYYLCAGIHYGGAQFRERPATRHSRGILQTGTAKQKFCISLLMISHSNTTTNKMTAEKIPIRRRTVEWSTNTQNLRCKIGSVAGNKCSLGAKKEREFRETTFHSCFRLWLGNIAHVVYLAS